MGFDLSSYDLICFGTPVWAFGPAPALNGYISQCYGITNKPAVLFTTYGSGLGVAKCLQYMQTILREKGVHSFKNFSLQQKKVADTAYVKKAIEKSLSSQPLHVS